MAKHVPGSAKAYTKKSFFPPKAILSMAYKAPRSRILCDGHFDFLYIPFTLLFLPVIELTASSC